MSEEEIIEGNKLIADFLELKPHPHDKSYYVNINGRTAIGRYDKLSYHSSWGSLMPVVDKIELNCLVTINRLGCLIEHTNSIVDAIEYTLHKRSKMQSVWLAVVEFIKFYNNQKQTP